MIDGNIGASSNIFDDPTELNDPYDNLKGIEELEEKCNLVNRTTAVSVVFLMKAIAVGVNVSGTPFLDALDQSPVPIPEPMRDVTELIFDREASGNGSFWWGLAMLDQQPSGGTEAQNFLIDIFYNSLTKEMRELFISPDYKRSLIYVDMPFMDVKSTEVAANQIDTFAAQDTNGDITSTPLVGVASVTIEVNNLIVGS